MAKTMIASMTDGQIDTAADQLRAAMRKHRDEIQKDAAQQALGTDNLGMRMFAVFRALAEAFSNMIVRTVKVDRTLTADQALYATGRKRYGDAAVIEAMPRGERDEEQVFFFKPDLSGRDGYISDDDLEKEYELRGLKPVDPYTLAQVNADDQAFADEYPHATHWKDANGKWCFATFNRWHDERKVDVSVYDYDWHDYWSFAGVRK